MRGRFLHVAADLQVWPSESVCTFLNGWRATTSAASSWLLIVAAILPLAGCGSEAPVDVQDDKSAQNLQLIGSAYTQATLKLARPPRDATELHEFIKNGPGNPDPATVLRSPDDNEDYVVVYGVDFREVAKVRGNVDVILAYEQRGKGGKRHILKPPAQVMVLTNEQFQAAAFPPGHTPAAAAPVAP